jgi:hypothetical protein
VSPTTSSASAVRPDPEVLGEALLIAHAADPEDLVPAMRALFLRTQGALDLTLHLIDYRQVSLRPIGSRRESRLLRAEPIADTALGDAYRLQEVTGQQVPAGYLEHVPVSARGQRLGVLTGCFATVPGTAGGQVLTSLALAVAYALLEIASGTDVYETGRRHGRMSVSAELQWQLLPARAYRSGHFYVAGHLEPALRVAGDAFDFAINNNLLTLSVIDATAVSEAPALVTTLVISALRNARRSELDLAEQASLTNEVVWQHQHGREYAAALLLQIDARSGRALAVDAGSPTVIRQREGHLDPLELDAQTPLGMLEDTEYHAEAVDLRPGDRIFVLSDGAIGEHHSMEQVIGVLADATRARDGQNIPPESVRRFVAALTQDGEEPEDDITVVCVDWIA